MTRVINNKMELNFYTAVFGSFTLYNAGVYNYSVAPGLSVFFNAVMSGDRTELFN